MYELTLGRMEFVARCSSSSSKLQKFTTPSVLVRDTVCLSNATHFTSPCVLISNGRHDARRTKLIAGFHQGAVYGKPGAFGDARALVQFAQNNGGDHLFVRSQATNERVDERSWSPLGVSHEIGDMVGEKYKIVGVLGHGGVGTTYEAELEDGTTVALKAMSLRNMKVWKDLDLFEREATVLKSLSHPNIPEYIDYFEVDSSSDRAFYIAQKVAKGYSLADLLVGGWRVTEEEVVRIALEVLEVLKYLGSLRPPVYHRDIKPENVILDKDTGKVKVVDFGAVQDAASVTLIGSTVVGTYGYMAPEQFQNKATLQTDLYGLGGTLLYLLSGQSPRSFPQNRLKVDFNKVIMSPRLAAIINKLLEPAPEDRFQSPLEAINALKNVCTPISAVETTVIKGENRTALEPLRQHDNLKLRRPAGTKVDIQKSAESLEISIPPAGLTAETIETGFFTVAWNAILTVWTKAALSRGAAGGSFALFSVPFWFVGMKLTRSTLSKLTVTVNLKIDEQKFAIEWRVGSLWKHRVAGNTKDINSAEVFGDEDQSGRSVTTCRVVEGVNTHKFGSGLQLVEKNWIVQEIRDFLEPLHKLE